MEDSESDEVLCYRQRLEKSTGGEMVLMEWSPTMDLLAAAFSDHSVALNRLSWQRVWTIPPTDADVKALAWRPDGKVLSVGHGDGCVRLYSVEDGHVLHEFSAGAPISHLHWTQLETNDSEGFEFSNSCVEFLPNLPALDTSQSSFADKAGEGEDQHPTDPKQLKTLSKFMNILMIGDVVGRTHLCVCGVFLAASMETASIKDAGHMLLTQMSHDFKALTTVTLSKDDDVMTKICLNTMDTPLIALKSHELHHLSVKFGAIGSVMEYMGSTLKAMHEAWEDLLSMMDSKLASYAKTLPEGKTVSDELLVLLACGRARLELQTFLMDELTAKGVKKLGLSLELSYTSIRKYVLSYLHSAIQHLQCHLSEVLGMARWYGQFGMLGLSEAAVQDCINHLGSFSLKSRELLLAIDDSLKSIKVFFSWLYTVILKLSGEPLPKEVKESLSSEELKMIVEFLRKRLGKATGGDSQSFNLEVVGQYLVDEDLKYVEVPPPSLFDKIVQTAELDHSTTAWLFQPVAGKSLVQLFHMLHQSIDKAFALPMESIQRSFSTLLSVDMATIRLVDKSLELTSKRIHPLVGHFVTDGGGFIYFPQDMELCANIVVLRQGKGEGSFESSMFHIGSVPVLVDEASEEKCEIISVQSYDEEALSVLFRYKAMETVIEPTGHTSSTETPPHFAVAQLPTSCLVSLPWKPHTSNLNDSIDIGVELTQVHSLGRFKADGLAVVGSRKLAAVLSSGGKKIRLFDVDTEEDDD